MKKIFLLFAAVCMFAACDPTHEDIKNDGNITVDELKAKSSVSLDKAASGQNGNVLTCKTAASVNAKWTIDGKDFIGNYAWKKLKLGNHDVTLTALCADGTELKIDYPVQAQEITNPLEKYYIYGQNPEEEPALEAGAWATMRFSSTEGVWPTISDDIYDGLKTLLIEIKDNQPGDDIWGAGSGPATVRIMNGWWSSTYADEVPVPAAGELMEIPITETIAAECAKAHEGRDLTLLIRRGTVKFGAVYYEE